MVRYPGTDSSSQGVGAHKDPGILRLLFVEPGVAGLQVERDGEWFDVPPVDDAFVVNIGELMEVATNGYLIATEHWVTTPQNAHNVIGSRYVENLPKARLRAHPDVAAAHHPDQ